MTTPRQPEQPNRNDPLWMADDDRFHKFIVSDPVRYEVAAGAQTILIFVVIRRGSGKYDVVNVIRTVNGGKPISNHTGARYGLPKSKVDKEVAANIRTLSSKVEKATGFQINWNTLDLSAIQDKQEQASQLAKWLSEQCSPVSLN